MKYVNMDYLAGISITIATILFIYYISRANKKYGDSKLYNLFCDNFQTIKDDWPRVVILSAIATISLTIHFLLKNDELFLHLGLEFIGVVVLFLIVEHEIKKLDSGISEFNSLPIEKFIDQVKLAKNEVILFDGNLELLLLNLHNFEKFKEALYIACSKHRKLKLRILVNSDTSLNLIQQAVSNAETVRENKESISVMHARLNLIKANIFSIDGKKNDWVIEFRDYDIISDFSLYAIDGKAYVSFFPTDRKTVSKYLFIPNDTGLGNDAVRYFSEKFESIWNKSKEIKL